MTGQTSRDNQVTKLLDRKPSQVFMAIGNTDYPTDDLVGVPGYRWCPPASMTGCTQTGILKFCLSTLPFHPEPPSPPRARRRHFRLVNLG
jgi:hypothetical protein